MSLQPKVSIIVPVYNTEIYLAKCLHSILAQTLTDIEIIIINDGSTDQSQEIIELFDNKDARIRSFQKENGGLSDARNFGLDQIMGQYIAFIDSDDYVDEKMIEKMYSLAIKHDADIVMCDLVKVDEEGNEFRDLPQSPQLLEKIILKEDLTIFGEMSCFACNKLFKNELFLRHRFRKGIHFEDIELIPKLVLDSKIIAKINQPFYKYFERKDSITRTHTKKGLDMFVAIDQVKKHFLNSQYSKNVNELERFIILQMFYSYLAYVAYVKDKSLKNNMIDELKNRLDKYEISTKKINNYQRFGNNYQSSLSLNKRLFYKAATINLNIIKML